MTGRVQVTTELTGEERKLIEAIDQSFRPEPMTDLQQAAFRRELTQRRERRTRVRRASFAVAATAAAAVLLWIANAPSQRPVRTTPEIANGEPEAPFVYAFVAPDQAVSGNYLPDDYAALASLLGLQADAP